VGVREILWECRNVNVVYKKEILGERRRDNLGTDRNILGRGQEGRNGARE